MINDRSFSNHLFKFPNASNNLKILVDFMLKLKVFDTDHPVIVFWDIIILILIIFMLIVAPIYFSFELINLDFILIIIKLIWSLDIFISLNRGFY